VTQENIDVGLRLIAAINTREISDELAQELIAPDYLIENVSTAVSDNAFRGAAGLRQWMSDTFEAVDDDARYEVEEILADGEDYLVTRVCIVGRGARSGVPVALRWFGVSWFHNGRITRTAGYLRRWEALKAVGPAE
jgi:ketosteroid isomerase-like protein